MRKQLSHRRARRRCCLHATHDARHAVYQAGSRLILTDTLGTVAMILVLSLLSFWLTGQWVLTFPVLARCIVVLAVLVGLQYGWLWWLLRRIGKGR